MGCSGGEDFTCSNYIIGSGAKHFPTRCDFGFRIVFRELEIQHVETDFL